MWQIVLFFCIPPLGQPLSSASQLQYMGYSFLLSVTGSLKLKPQASAVGKCTECLSSLPTRTTGGEEPSDNCPRQPSFEQTILGGNCGSQMSLDEWSPYNLHEKSHLQTSFLFSCLSLFLFLLLFTHNTHTTYALVLFHAVLLR